MNKIGAWYKNNKCHFCLWSPQANSIQLKNLDTNEIYSLERDKKDYWSLSTDWAVNTPYKYIIDNNAEVPDPVSFYQKDGVHGPSRTFDHNDFQWTDSQWQGIKVQDMIIYELHTATFTKAGDFESIKEKIPHLKSLGINSIEIMPIAQFPGKRNWGYDGVYPFAVQNSYGGPDQLKSLVDTCHKNNIAIILDVVYNHLGPEGNYLSCFAPYFTGKYTTPWGDAINFDDKYSQGVREYFISNALYWLDCFHIDALRLDAIHGIYDKSKKHILAELSEQIELLNKKNTRQCFLIAESDLNDSTNIRSLKDGGHGIDAQWNDDFHHALHCLFTGDNAGYFKDFASLDCFFKAYTNNFVYDGVFSKFRNKIHGNNCSDLHPNSFVVFSQNHDQIGNRMLGERLISLTNTETAKVIAALTILHPSIPMLYMGEEYGETNPFLYFIDHSDKELIKAVQKGRADEFKDFMTDGDVPDPYKVDTFRQSKLDWSKLSKESNNEIFLWYKALIQLRINSSAFSTGYNRELKISQEKSSDNIFIFRQSSKQKGMIVFNPKAALKDVKLPEGQWTEYLGSSQIKIYLSDIKLNEEKT